MKKTSPQMNPKMSMDDKKWQAESDLRTLLAAEEIKKNRSRLARAKQEAKRQASAISKVSK